MNEKSSRVSGFYKLTPFDRLKFVKDFSGLTEDEVKLIQSTGALSIEDADRMVENVIGVIQIPLGIAVNFLINGKDYLIPMAIEEPSVIAAASNAAKMARVKGGFFASSLGSIMIGQIQVVDVIDVNKAKELILSAKNEILNKANEQDRILVSIGGGAKDLDVKIINTFIGPMVIVELFIDCKDAMGANVVNTMCEAVAPLIERITDGKVLMRIVSNLAIKRLVKAKAVFDKKAIGGEEVVDGIIKGYAFALADPFRCVTHNKGIMNGIIALALATGNDTRAIEAGAHSYASRSGRYMPLTTWEKDEDGNLIGSIELPLAVGIVGGITKVHPIAKIALKILKVKSASELAEVMASVGLAQNFAALRALVTEGIQRGHMKLHARNIAAMAGAKGELIDKIAQLMIETHEIRIDKAKELLKSFSKN
ncbi:MAG: hydroxymethylglutaryl-CoA reductase, degradative [Candidatus Bathyarchaeia archaeon]